MQHRFIILKYNNNHSKVNNILFKKIIVEAQKNFPVYIWYCFSLVKKKTEYTNEKLQSILP